MTVRTQHMTKHENKEKMKEKYIYILYQTKKSRHKAISEHQAVKEQKRATKKNLSLVVFFQLGMSFLYQVAAKRGKGNRFKTQIQQNSLASNTDFIIHITDLALT